MFDRLRKGALAAFREEEPIDLEQSLEAKQLKDIVFRENADLLYTYDETQPIEGITFVDSYLAFDNVDLSLEFPDDTGFLDLFNFSEGSDIQIAGQGGLQNAYPSADATGIPSIGLSQGSLIPPIESKARVQQAEVDKAVEILHVCSPCKKRRIKCDMLLPSCRNCTKLQKECTYWDNALSQEIPRR